MLIKKYHEAALKYGCKMILYTGEDIEKEAFAVGARGYISKPCGLETMEGIIKRVMNE